jgi:hypothetical protein
MPPRQRVLLEQAQHLNRDVIVAAEDACIGLVDHLSHIASNGGSNPWDTATGWAADTSWVVAQPWAQPPGGGGN